MCAKRLILVIVVLFVFLLESVYAYEVEKERLYEQDSRFLSSQLTFDLTAAGSDNGTTTTSDLELQTDVGVNVVTEKRRTGSWINADVELTMRETDDGSTVTELSQLELKNFAYTSTDGFLAGGFADAGFKLYLLEQSSLFVFVQGLANWHEESKTPDDPNGSNTGLESLAGAGVGYGKILDLGSYEKVLIIQNKLMEAGVITTKFSKSVISELLSLFRHSMEKTNRLNRAIKILVKNGLVDEQDITFDITKIILDEVDGAFEKRQLGIELRTGYLKEMTHRDENQDKSTWIYGYAKVERPLAKNHQFTSQLDYFLESQNDQRDNTTFLAWRNSISSTFGRDSTSEIGVEINYRTTTETDTSSQKIFGQYNYELTDVVTWANTIAYEMFQYDDPGVDDTSQYTVTSRLVYTIW